MPEIAGIGVAWAFLAGLVSFMSPCVLPLVPGYLAYVGGRSVEELRDMRFSRARLETLALSAAFVFGFSLVFVAFGASATLIGQLLLGYRAQADIVAGAVVALFGLHLAGVLRVSFLSREWRLAGDRVRPLGLGAVLLGAAFAFGWTPCIGPILGSILTLGATRAGVGDGVLLLSVYSLGLAVPFLLVGTFTGGFMKRLETLRRIGRPLQAVAGLILAGVGLAMAAGILTRLGTWLLATFPWFRYLAV